MAETLNELLKSSPEPEKPLAEVLGPKLEEAFKKFKKKIEERKAEKKLGGPLITKKMIISPRVEGEKYIVDVTGIHEPVGAVIRNELGQMANIKGRVLLIQVVPE